MMPFINLLRENLIFYSFSKRENKMSNLFRIALVIMSSLVVLSCGAVQTEYLPKEYTDTLKNSSKSGIVMYVSDRNLTETLEYGENVYRSTMTGEWVQGGVSPRNVLYSMVLESCNYLYQVSSNQNSYDFMIIPNVTASKIRMLNSSSRNTDLGETVYEKEYSAELSINIKVIDKKQKEILNISKNVNGRASGAGGGAYENSSNPNVYDWARRASITNASTNAVVKAISDALPAINKEISENDSVVQLDNIKIKVK
jgi:hypothetical protein